tara:strand:+ start:107 stop:433 length:327 start_codon:yes stop_codon:yes gene_type:complete
MNHINALKKWFLNILLPRIESMPYLAETDKKKNSTVQEQRFRDLFKKRKSLLIVGSFIFCLTVFGVGKSFNFFAGFIAFSPVVVIVWSSFGEQLMRLFKFKKNKKGDE